MFCTKCGTQNADGATFCSGCGAQLGAAKPAQPVQPAQGYAQPVQPVQAGSYLFGLSFLGLQSADPSWALKQKIVKLLIAIGALVALIGTLLPYYTIEFFGMKESVHYVQGADGILILLLSIVSIVFALILKGKLQKWTVISSGLSLLIAFIGFISATSKLGSLGVGHFGAGVFFVFLGVIAALVGAILDWVWKLETR